MDDELLSSYQTEAVKSVLNEIKNKLNKLKASANISSEVVIENADEINKYIDWQLESCKVPINKNKTDFSEILKRYVEE